MDSRLLALLQLCDSNFPSGAFSHSFGLETYIQEEQVNDKATFALWLHVYLDKQLVYTDGLACRLVYEALQQQCIEKVWETDRMITVQNVPRESREGSRRMGERMIQLGRDVFSVPLLAEYKTRIREKSSFGHPAVAFAIIAHHLSICIEQTVLAFLYTSIASLVQNGVRAIPLGQTDGQRLIADFQPPILQARDRILKLDRQDLGAVSPGLEIAQMRHEKLDYRLFMS